jgi:hypothetical protein
MMMMMMMTQEVAMAEKDAEYIAPCKHIARYSAINRLLHKSQAQKARTVRNVTRFVAKTTAHQCICLCICMYQGFTNTVGSEAFAAW